MSERETPAGRRGRRRPAAAADAHAVFDRTRFYRKLRNPFTPLKVFSEDQVATMHEAALGMLENQGMKVLSANARALYRKAGAEVDESTLFVRMERALVTDCLAKAPRDITLYSLDPERHVPLADGHVAFAPTSGPPNVMDSAGGRRSGTLEDFRNLIKLCQTFEVIHVLGGATEPQDVPVQLRHLQFMRSQLELSDAATVRSPTCSSCCASLIG